MTHVCRFALKTAALLSLLVAVPAYAGHHDVSDAHALKRAALEALMNAPPERALVLLERTLANSTDEKLKERALFVLGQIDLPAARQRLLIIANDADNARLQHEAIRSIGIGGDSAAVNALLDVYRRGDASIRESVLRALLIAGEEKLVLEVAREASSDEEFEDAVRVLGAMGATEELATLRDRAKTSSGLIRAYAIANDLESLEALLDDESDPQMQRRVLRAMGIVGGDKVGSILARHYRQADDEEVREAALQGLLVAGQDGAVIKLFGSSDNDKEKRKLLRLLVNMGSEEALDVIDRTLNEEN